MLIILLTTLYVSNGFSSSHRSNHPRKVVQLGHYGGLKAVALSDTINGYGLLIGGIMVPLLALISIGYGNPLAGLSKVFEHAPEKFNVIGAKDSVMPFGALFTGLIINQLYFWCKNQTIIQRTKSVARPAGSPLALIITNPKMA